MHLYEFLVYAAIVIKESEPEMGDNDHYYPKDMFQPKEIFHKDQTLSPVQHDNKEEEEEEEEDYEDETPMPSASSACVTRTKTKSSVYLLGS